MITADDPRHGQNRGYNAGCREECCRHAHALYRNLQRMGRLSGRYVDARGSHRRLLALACLGWPMTRLAHEAGKHKQWAWEALERRSVDVETARLVADLYDRLCMTPYPTPTRWHETVAARTKAWAATVGGHPPLAWDDIDEDDGPADAEVDLIEDEVDEVAIQRRMSGDTTAHLTKAERRALVVRWAAAGRSLAELDRVHGINPHRELKEAAA